MRRRKYHKPTEEEEAAWKARIADQARIDAEFAASMPEHREPKIICLDCRRGPLDGVAVLKRGGVFKCETHA